MERWLVRLGNNVINNNNHIIFFPHAGGSIYSFIPFTKKLDSQAIFSGIELAGRGGRINEPYSVNFTELIEELSFFLSKRLSGNIIFIGHSLGALIAFECIRHLENISNLKVSTLIVSGQLPPQITDNALLIDYNMNDANLAKFLVRLGGISSEMLKYPDLLSLVLATIRADCKLLSSYKYQPTTISSNILCITATNDPIIASNAKCNKWQEVTKGQFFLNEIRGGHFSILNDEITIGEVTSLLTTKGILN